MRAPLVSIVLPVFNGTETVKAAVDSILSQTLADFELLIVDDGSSDGSGALIQDVSDPRIRFWSNDSNQGLVRTLNTGLEQSRGEFIARMDADDVSLPHRLEKQVAFMRSHPEVGIAGCWSETFGGRRSWYTRFPVNHDEIAASLPFGTALSHPTVIMRTASLQRFRLSYNPAYEHAEDYGLWAEAEAHVKLANVPEVLFRYRQHANQVSAHHHSAQRAASDRVRRMMLERFGIFPSAQQWQIHTVLCSQDWPAGHDFLHDALAWVDHIARNAAGDEDRKAAVRSVCNLWKDRLRRHHDPLRSVARQVKRALNI